LPAQASPEVLQAWLDSTWQDGFFSVSSEVADLWFPFERLSLVDGNANVLALRESDSAEFFIDPYVQSEAFKARLRTPIREAYDSNWDQEGYAWAVVLPVSLGAQEAFVIVEFSYLKTPVWGWFLEFLQSLWKWLALSLVIGTVFGYLASRGLVRRLKQLGQGVQGWSQGDFAIQLKDDAGDEISELASNLNRMALQLESVVQTKEQLGALEERGRLARELHDTIKQQVFSAQMQLSALQLAHPDKPDMVSKISHDLLELNKTTQRDLASIIEALRPALLEDVGLLEAVKRYGADWQERTGIVLEVSGELPPKLSLDAEFSLYRIIGEALTNTEKHAHATTATVSFEQQKNALVTTITDNGQGFTSQEKQAGYGLISMKERLSNLNGTLSVNSSNEGTIVTAHVPLELEAQDV